MVFSYVFMCVHGCSCVFMGVQCVHGCSWVFMGVHGCSWVFMGVHGCSWVFMGVHVFSCVFMGVFSYFPFFKKYYFLKFSFKQNIFEIYFKEKRGSPAQTERKTKYISKRKRALQPKLKGKRNIFQRERGLSSPEFKLKPLLSPGLVPILKRKRAIQPRVQT